MPYDASPHSRVLERQRYTQPPREGGFTLIELLTSITVAGILLAIAVSGMFALARSEQEQSTASGLLAALRTAQVRAQAEGRAYCVRLDAAQLWSVWRYSCDPLEAPSIDFTPGRVAMGNAEGTAVVTASLTSAPVAGLAHSCPPASLGCAFFYPRGLSSQGTVTVSRPGSTSVYTLNVVGLTGRVFLSH